jgi:hypothetical protein
MVLMRLPNCLRKDLETLICFLGTGFGAVEGGEDFGTEIFCGEVVFFFGDTPFPAAVLLEEDLIIIVLDILSLWRGICNETLDSFYR